MILIRHGESQWNEVYNRTGVSPDIPDPHLTQRGRDQVKRAAEALAQLPIRRVLVSPYTRALQTAEIIARALDLPMEVEPLVREHANFHCDVGTPRSRLAEIWPALDFAHLEETWWPTAETEAELLARCRSFHVKAADLRDWRHVAVVTHWGFIRGLTGRQARNAELVPFDPERRGL